MLFLGGARSGKSAAAEARAVAVAGSRSVVYVATAPLRPDDPEWTARITEHRARRPAGWQTVETGDVVAELRAAGVVLVDCLSLWLTRVMDEANAWDGAAGAAAQVDRRCAALTGAWRAATGYVIAVSSEVGLGVVPVSPAGRLFRDRLGQLNAAVAQASDEVALVVAGRLLRLTDPGMP
ncbi:MAG TPA: bifunctional adenosylcobinamide kinase/adenosylcobinamide-phosphate guanylyltransferase [Sporichthyaceae bacterium]|nr:bifunctional adenosylcobinamide kinase/adenosylcobinamide-phosphate guanylyltransferase [Sporichthyaceae bacterium]